LVWLWQDGALLMAHCVREVSFLVAAVSMKRFLVGDLARACRAIPVERPQDVASLVRTPLSHLLLSCVCAHKVVGAWLLLLLQGCGVVTGSGNEVIGERTKFTAEFTVGDSISIKGLEPALITEIVSDEKLIVKTPHEHPITEKMPYKIFKKVDQSNVYQHVWAALGRGDWYAARGVGANVFSVV
jgi:hypothetical protein